MKKVFNLLLSLCLLSGVLLLHSCKKDPEIPVVTTVAISDITTTSAVSGGNVTSDGGAEVVSRGVCWGTSANPTIAGSSTTDGTGTGAFTSSLTGLTPNTPYFVRAYATNSAGTAYGNEVSFTTGQVITVATVTTAAPSSVELTTAVSGGNVTSDGGGTVTERGVCWNTAANPTVSNFKAATGAGTGTFVSNLTNLDPGTVYFVRAYAINSAGVTYGEEFRLNTKIDDADGNHYRTVIIGSQMWMAENLKTTLYNDDTEIPLVTDNTEWSNLLTPAYCWYDNDEATNKALHGALYNWFAVETGNLCPDGWHVPTDADFKTLEQHLGIAADQIDITGWRGTDQGAQLKNTSGWNTDENGSNTSGFTALPSGYRFYETGAFNGIATITYWWSETNEGTDLAWYRRLDGDNDAVFRSAAYKKAGKSVRCVKD